MHLSLQRYTKSFYQNAVNDKIQIVVSEEDKPERLDIFLARKLNFISRTRVKSIIEAGGVLLNKNRIKPSTRVKRGDLIEIIIPSPEPAKPGPEPIPLKILYEDKDIIVFEKPAGLLVHPVPGKMRGTLVNALLYHCKDLSGIGGEIKPGIVHRLDKLTSGVMVAAKSEKAHLNLAEQFKRHSIERVYLALVFGNPPQNSGRIETKIERNPKHRLKMTARTGRGRIAVTEWRVRKRFSHFSLIECRLHTGRTHQIRVHLSELGYPLVGDELYGKGRSLPAKISVEIKDAMKNLKRQALHAYKLGFEHPISRKWMVFNSPLPEELDYLVKLLERYD